MTDLHSHTPTGTLDGAIALVTGVSRPHSIGAAICRSLAAAGADVFFTHWLPFDQQMGYDTSREHLSALEVELGAFGTSIRSMEIDLSLPESPVQVMNEVEAQIGTPTILVNNAAHSSDGTIDTLDAASVDAHYAVNIRGMALLSSEFVRRYPGGPGGRIINLTSGQSVGPMPDVLVYATTKGAVEAFTTSVAPAVAARGITVNAVDPGATDTGWMSTELLRTLTSTMQMGRVGEPDDAARLITFIAGPEAAWITGQVMHSRGA